MELILLALAVILAVFLGWILKQTFNTQPWVADVVGESAHEAPFGANAKVVALTVLLAVITSFFALVMSAYAERMKLGDWIPVTEPQLLWINTGFLAAASIVFQWTRNRAAAQAETLRLMPRLMPGMLITGVLTFAFIVGQLIAWRQLNASGVYLAGNPAETFFFFMTGLHAVHMLGGLYVWARATVRLATGHKLDTVRQSVELCAVYWHFLLLVWLVMFGLLLAT